MNYTMMLLTQRQEELEQELMKATSMVNKATITAELVHVRDALASQEEEES